MIIQHIEEYITAAFNGSNELLKRKQMDAWWIQEFRISLLVLPRRSIIITRWNKPLEGQVKLNTDGSSKGNPGLCGGRGRFEEL